ncbi:hypothetical protein HRbin02_01570 [Candidatus Calditenuaceae archaeon HR02]|nr:hypothetical protein HRbin02_01570 [Candidatus Calditenuaceae archaeon HR02]
MRARHTGLAAAWAAYFFIAAAIGVSPWFNIYDNALSDLGNYGRQGLKAAIFNTGLIVSGLLASITAVLILRGRRHRLVIPWSILLFLAGIDLVSVGILSEDFGAAHGTVSVILFTLFGLTMLVYGVCSLFMKDWGAGVYAIAAFLATLATWIIDWPWTGIAIQETIASLLVSIGLTIIAIRHG